MVSHGYFSIQGFFRLLAAHSWPWRVAGPVAFFLVTGGCKSQSVAK
jgi:hypothetical protein